MNGYRATFFVLGCIYVVLLLLGLKQPGSISILMSTIGIALCGVGWHYSEGL